MYVINDIFSTGPLCTGILPVGERASCFCYYYYYYIIITYMYIQYMNHN